MSRRVIGVLVGIVAVLVVLGVIGTLAGREGSDDGETALRGFGPPAATACRPPTDHPASGASQHVAGDVTYDRTPPNSGPHHAQWATVRKRVYTPDDAPPVEQVVHNLEHGYVVVWYDPARTDGGPLDDALTPAQVRKLFAVPWTRDANLPAPYVLTAWGHEQQCTDVSGEAIANFVAEHGGGNGDAPEPDAP